MKVPDWAFEADTDPSSLPLEAPPIPKSQNWSPNLNPTQFKIFNCPAKYVLAEGEKGTGKTVGVLHALVRHCYEEQNALALIITAGIFAGKEGALHDLQTLVLPAWRDGNLYPDFLNGKRHPKAGEPMDAGIGLEYSEAKQDPDTKDRILMIRNRHGGLSKVILKSIPYAEAVQARMFGPAPSFVFADEITNMSGEEYFTFPAAQLGRRRGIDGPQQYYASCNPDGPRHWVYQRWFVTCIDEAGKRDHDFAVFHVSISENEHRLPPGYMDGLRKLFKDPIQRRRLVDGEWVDRPSGDSIFKEYWVPEIHIRGDKILARWEWKPRTRTPEGLSIPIIFGIDNGPVNYSGHFMQMIPTKEKTIWVVFDELNFVGQRKTNRQFAAAVVKRMDFWNGICGHQFSYLTVADSAAFTQVNSDGSFDAMELQKFSEGRISPRPCPKGKGSIKERVVMVQGMLTDQTLFVSAACPKTVDMMRMIASAKPKPGVYDPDIAFTPVKSVYTHPFSSMTYPLFFVNMMPGRYNALGTQAEVETRVYGCGA